MAADLVAVLATCARPRRRGCGAAADDVALKRGRLDAVTAGPRELTQVIKALATLATGERRLSSEHARQRGARHVPTDQ